jgi:hypothetical protein
MRKPILLSLTLILLFGLQNTARVDASAARIFDPPIAYIGWDGNVWMTDLKSGEGVRLTRYGKPWLSYQDLIRFPYNFYRDFYRNLNWSADGATLSADDVTRGYGEKELIVRSGQTPIHLNIYESALSPDGKSLSKITCAENNLLEIVETSIKNGKKHIIPTGVKCGDAPLASTSYVPPLNVALLWREQNSPTGSVYPNRFEITAFGYLVGAYYGDKAPSPMRMIRPDGELLWEIRLGDFYVFSPDRKWAWAVKQNFRDDPVVVLNLLTGEMRQIQADGPYFYYTSAYALMPDLKAGLVSEVEWVNYYSEYNLVILSRVFLDSGIKEEILRLRATAIGSIVPVPDGKGAVISLVTLRSLARTATHPAYAWGDPHVELLYIDLTTHEVRFIAAGGQPAVGTRPFTAIPVN